MNGLGGPGFRAAMAVAVVCLLTPVWGEIRLAPVRDDAFPDSCAVDLSHLLSAPAGKAGFLTVKDDGRLHFGNGERARFFGVNIAKSSVFADHKTIDRVIGVLARAGVNLVRFHHFDGSDGLLDGSRDDELGYFSRQKLDSLDYWIARAREAGIYIYLDLLDYREFTAEEGVMAAETLGRGAKPFAVFDPRLRELQKEYARRLLRDHVNAYTRLPYADDPAVAFIEIFDENGLFIRRGDLLDFPWQYRQPLTAQWNEWLRKRYGSTEALRRAWTGPDGEGSLMAYESLEKASVRLPVMTLRGIGDQEQYEGREGSIRKSDGALFFYEVHCDFYKEMRDYLRSLGVKVPIGAVGSLDQLPDLKATADSLDYIGTNFYWDHPAWRAGNDWKPPFYFTNDDPIRELGLRSAAARLAAARVAGKPLVVREWCYCWPNEYRGAGMLELTALCALQDIDVMIAFTYDVPDKPTGIGFFDIHRDPLRWGLIGLLAKAFLSGDVAAARSSVEIAYSKADTFSYFGYLTPLYSLGYVSRVANRLYDDTWTSRADLTIASGRTVGGRLQGNNVILFNSSRRSDLRGNQAAQDLCDLYGYTIPQYTPQPAESDSQAKPPAIYQTWRGFALESVRQAGYVPIGADEKFGFALGFYDPLKRNYVFRNVSATTVLHTALDALGRSGNESLGRGRLETDRFVSDTGEIISNSRQGVIRVVTPMFVGIANSRSQYSELAAGPFVVTSPSPLHVFLGASLDGKPLDSSRRFALKMVTRAVNEGQQVGPASAGQKPYVVSAGGGPGIRTYGRRSDGGLRVQLNGQELLRADLRDGTWELIVEGDRATIWCDTPGVTFVYRSSEAITIPDFLY